MITNVVVLVISREKDTSKGKVQVADSSPVSTSNSFSADSNSDLEKVAEIDKMPQVGTSSSHMNVSEHSASEEPHVDSPKASSEHTESQAMVDGS